MNTRIQINRSFDILPHEHIEKKVNEYTLFMKEYENSNKYRLICSFKPICSNILFNTITEVVGKEGSDECVFYGKNGKSKTSNDVDTYQTYTNRDDTYLTRAKMIEDTGYSHPKAGNISYHCGYDIFNNHRLRSKDFVIVNKIGENYDNVKKTLFNTLSDYVRDENGILKQEKNLRNATEDTSKEFVNKHLYVSDTILNYFNSITENLTEVDGWLGFLNKGTLNIPNYNNYSINRVINNKETGEFIDFYPDRSLYSILPKYNEYRERYENNWEFCLTYPFENDETHELVSYKYTNNNIEYSYNGIECIFKLEDVLQISEVPDSRIITLRTFVEHGLVTGDKVKLSVFYKKKDGTTYTYETPNNCTIIGVGSTSYEKKQYFKIRITDIQNLMINLGVTCGLASITETEESGIKSYNLSQPFAFDMDYFEDNDIKFRFAKINGNKKCKYYLRKFQHLKNKNNEEYSYTLNKLAYSNTAYGEKCGEIIFDEIIDVDGILDNNGRQLNEIFLTTFKTNYGHKEWYYDKNYTGDTIEFSHCFGKITSGFDLPADEKSRDYNVHCLHNIDAYIKSSNATYPESGKPINEDITIKTEWFYGDLVEFNEYTLQENILEEIHFRFNTTQREYYNDTDQDDEFKTFTYSEINIDDEDMNATTDSSFLTDKDIRFNNENKKDENVHININPEGYIYKANQRIVLKEYDENIQWGNDTYVDLLTITACTTESATGFTYNEGESNEYKITVGEYMYEYEITCDETILSDKYIYFNIYDKIYLLDKSNFKDKVYGMITYVDMLNKKYRFIVPISALDEALGKKRTTNKRIDNYSFFRENPLKPKNIYMIQDGSGVYNWQEFKKHSDIEQNSPLYNRPFVNDTHYLYKDIVFYLKRQDPSGLYMLSFNSDMQLYKLNFLILGNQKDVSNNNYVTIIEPTLC